MNFDYNIIKKGVFYMRLVKTLNENTIRYFNNKIVITVRDNKNIETDIIDCLFWSDCYFNIINGYLYITQNNNVYSLIYNGYNFLSLHDFLNVLVNNTFNSFTCYKLNKKESKVLLQNMENGY
jgi:hypothetical protein